MGEKIILADFDFNIDAAVKDTQELGNKVNTLKERLKELKKSNQEGSAEWIKTSAQLNSVLQLTQVREKSLAI